MDIVEKYYCHLCECVLSHVRLFVTPWTVAHQVPLSMKFFQAWILEELHFPSPGDIPDSEIKLMSLASPTLAGGFFTI